MDREYTWIIKPDYLYCSIMVVDDYHCTFKFGNKNFHESNYFPYVGYDLEYQMPYMTEYPYSVINPDTGLYGYKNKLDELIIPYIYAGDGYFNSDGLAIVETTNNTFKIIDCFNNSTNEYYGIGTPLFPSYPNDYPSDSIVGVMEKNGLWGIIDAKHDRPPVKRYLVKPQFEDIYECIEGHAAVKKDGKWGLIKINFGKERALSSTEKNDITKKNIIDEIKLYGGDLIILSSVSENDRSTLALNIAEKTTLMYPERNTLILSTKAPKEEIYKKISPSSSITIYDNISTTDGILSTIMNANENSKLGLVIIDEEKYIDVSEDSFIPDELTYDEKIINENLRIETITCSLKALAKRLNIPILLLTHIKKDTKYKLAKAIWNILCRTSMGNDADLILLMDDNSNISNELSVIKNRRGDIGNFHIEWQEVDKRYKIENISFPTFTAEELYQKFYKNTENKLNTI